MTNWIDISVPLRNGMVQWPEDPTFHLQRVMDQKKGDTCTLSRVNLSAHTGTHMDAPLHFIRDSPSIDEMPLDATVGRARVISVRTTKAITADDLREHELEANERVLFKTANSDRLWSTGAFDEDFIYIARDGAEYLAERGVRTVGIDYLSVGGFRQDSVETHEALLGAGIWLIEGLNLSGVEPGEYELVCLPLLLVGAEGAPARAILRSVES